MPIIHRVDSEDRVVVAVGYGVLTDADVFGYQQTVWSRAEVAGYDELIDMTRVTLIAVPSIERIRDLVELSVGMDDQAATSRLAIVAPADVAFDLGRMYQSRRDLDRRSKKEVGVFRTMEEALAFLRIDHPLIMPAPR